MTSVLGENIEKWGIVTEIDEGTAEIDDKEKYIPGRETPVDYSSAITGGICYKMRKMKIVLSFVESDKTKAKARINDIKNLFHGQKGPIILPDETEFYYTGRIKINSKRIDSKQIEITFDIQANPYKQKIAETMITREINGSATVLCNNLRQRVVPTVTTTSQMSITLGNRTISVGKGTHVLDMVFEAGPNYLEVEGSGMITIIYREGSL